MFHPFVVFFILLYHMNHELVKVLTFALCGFFANTSRFRRLKVVLRYYLPLPPLRGPPPPPRGGGLPLCTAHCYLYHPRDTLEQQNKRQLEHKRKAPLCKGSWRRRRLKDCSHAKLTLHRRKRNRLNPARKTVGAQTGGSH